MDGDGTSRNDLEEVAKNRDQTDKTKGNNVNSNKPSAESSFVIPADAALAFEKRLTNPDSDRKKDSAGENYPDDKIQPSLITENDAERSRVSLSTSGTAEGIKDSGREEDDGTKKAKSKDDSTEASANGPPSVKSSEAGADVKARKEKRKRSKQPLYQQLFRDAFQIAIPLTVTADLGAAMQRSRAKRIKTIYRLFPSIREEQEKLEQQLKEENEKKEKDGEDDKDLKGDSLNDSSRGPGKRKPLPKLKHVPKPKDYATVLDYLEAKYVQGIMIDDEGEAGNSGGENANEDDEGGGSVYSETSFLDDSALQRTVAEQVLGQTTTTMMELIQSNDDDFFVNVGPLEVEETELTKGDYDPLKDTEKDKIAASKRKRLLKKMEKSSENSKKESASTSKESKSNEKGQVKQSNSLDKSKDAASVKKKKKLSEDGNESVQPPKKKKMKVDDDESIAVKSSSKKKEKSDKLAKSVASTVVTATAETKARKKPGKKPMSDKAKTLLKQSKLCKKKVDSHLKKIEEYIKTASNDELPKKSRAKKLRVELRCPPDKKTGDMITFSNPHVPEQKLRVKIPPNRTASGTFKVTIPIPNENEGEDADIDHNRVSRKFYVLLEEYAQCFDEWCDAEGEYRAQTGDTEFTAHFEKRKKFDALIPLFPNSDLKTPVDKAYLQKILRRARQNKHKRDRLLAMSSNDTTVTSQVKSSKKHKDDDDDDVDDDDSSKKHKSNVKKGSSLVLTPKKQQAKTISILVPRLSTLFPTQKFDFKEIFG